jgi:hypothetical protein
MFGTVLEKLSTLLSKSFVISSFFPMLISAAANGLMLYFVSGRFRSFLKSVYDPNLGSTAVLMFVVLSLLAVVAYVFSPLNLTLREILEGRYWPERFTQWGQGRHIRSMDLIQDRYTDANSNRRDLDRFDQIAFQLIAARKKGAGKNNFAPFQVAEKSISELLKKRRNAQDIPQKDLEATLKLLERALESADADIVDTNSADSVASGKLDRSQQDFFRVWKYRDNRSQAETIRLYNLLQSNYSQNEVAATAMGNIAIAARYYAESRYGMSLDVFWSRLQKVLQQDEKFYAVLQDAKTQLDFLVSMFWLTTCFCVLWTLTLPFAGHSYGQFLLVVILVPWIAAGFYGLGVQNYRAFADLLRSSVDMFRMQLLKELHIPLPDRAEEERVLWTQLGNHVGYDSHEKNLTFAHPKTP